MEEAALNSALPTRPVAQCQLSHDLEVNIPELRAGDICPVCQKEYLDYNGLLNLACPRCGEMAGTGGSFS